MEDKTFELIEKLYCRMEEGFKEVKTEVIAEIQGIEQRLEQRIDRVEQNMVRLEQKFDDKIGILFDAVQGNTEAIGDLKGEMQKLETKVDEHEVKLKIVK